MAGPYSTLQDFIKHWPALPDSQHTIATQKIDEASTEIDGLYPDVEQRLADGVLKLATVRLVVNRMVKRALDTSAEELAGVTSATAQAGPFAQTLNFSNPDATMYISAPDKRLLSAGRDVRRAFTIHPNPGV